MNYLDSLHEKHEDWLGSGLDLNTPYEQAQKALRSRRSIAASNLQPVVQSPSGLLLPNKPSQRLRDSLYYLDAGRSPQEMQPCLHRVPALVLDCNADVLDDLDLQREVQATVADYITFMRDSKELRRKQMLEQLLQGGSSGSSKGSSSSQRGALGSQPGAPDGVQRQATELVQEAARGADGGGAKVVPNSSGRLQDTDAAEQLQPQGSVSGSLEALQSAVAAAAMGNGASAHVDGTTVMVGGAC